MIRVRDQSATEGDSQVPDCPLDHVSSYTCNLLNPSVTSTPRVVLLVVLIWLSPHADMIYGNVSNTSPRLLRGSVLSAWFAASFNPLSSRAGCYRVGPGPGVARRGLAS